MDSKCVEKYIEEKKLYSTVKPTCTEDFCGRDKRAKWKHQTVRRLNKKYEQETWMRRKLQVIKRREQVERKRLN